MLGGQEHLFQLLRPPVAGLVDGDDLLRSHGGHVFPAVLAQGAQIDPLAFSQGQRLGPSRGIEAALELVVLGHSVAELGRAVWGQPHHRLPGHRARPSQLETRDRQGASPASNEVLRNKGVPSGIGGSASSSGQREFGIQAPAGGDVDGVLVSAPDSDDVAGGGVDVPVDEPEALGPTVGSIELDPGQAGQIAADASLPQLFARDPAVGEVVEECFGGVQTSESRSDTSVSMAGWKVRWCDGRRGGRLTGCGGRGGGPRPL